MNGVQKLLETPQLQQDTSVASLLPADDPSLTLPPPTKDQVAYWRELVGVLHTQQTQGKLGVSDADWPADLTPSRPTLRALEERKIITRRKRAWRLTKHGYLRLSACVERAVPTPPLTIPERPGPSFPSYAEMERWEQVCRWLDAQPNRRARLPFTGLLDLRPSYLTTDLPLPELHGMRRYRLVRHTSSCEWALSPTWKTRLLDLWQGRKEFLRDGAPPDTHVERETLPRVVAAGLDTWYLNWLSDVALPPRLRAKLDALQAQAREEDTELETPWTYDGAPLQMYRFGSSAAQSGGVSWGYILRNPSVNIAIRKAPLGRVIAQVRLGAECLWRLTPLRALNELDALFKRLWGNTFGQWQVSQAHLAVDVVNAPISADGLSRFVSRSRKQAVYEAARSQIEALQRDLRGEHKALGDDDDLTLEWDDPFAEALDDLDVLAELDDPFDPFADDDDDLFGPRISPSALRAQADLDTPLEERPLTTYRQGKRYSGASWSVGGAISFVLYDKTLQNQLTNRRYMESIWAANGRRADERVTRNELRLRREVFRELRLPGNVTPCLDDPWQFLEHLQDVWGHGVGQPEEDCPDAVNVAWIRQVVPLDNDSNRSRWPTDLAWRVVQQATFADAPAPARRLIRRKQQAADVLTLDRLNYGTLVSRVARLHPHGGQYDLSMAVGEIVPALRKESAKAGKDFGTLVRERRRKWGLRLPVQDKVLPFHAASSGAEETLAPSTAGDALPAEEDAPPSPDMPATPDDVHSETQAALRLKLAEQRLQTVLNELQAASARDALPWELQRWEQAYEDEMRAYSAAYTVCYPLDGGTGSIHLDGNQPDMRD